MNGLDFWVEAGVGPLWLTGERRASPIGGGGERSVGAGSESPRVRPLLGAVRRRAGCLLCEAVRDEQGRVEEFGRT